jgi:hypothetical protein
MARRRFRVDQYRDIVRRLQVGESCRSIAKAGLASRNTIREISAIAQRKGWIAASAAPSGASSRPEADTAPPGARMVLPGEQEILEAFEEAQHSSPPPEHASKVERYRGMVEGWVAQGIRIKTIYQALLRQAPPFEGSYSSVYRFINRIQDRTPEVFVPLSFEPGEAAQVDFGSGPVLTNPQTGKKQRTHFFIMTLCFSRHMYVEFVWDQKVKTWLRCHRNAFAWFSGVPKKIIVDNLKSGITRACRYDPVAQRSYEDLARDYGFIISACKPHTPRHKGRVEAGVKYVKGSFIPLRDFRDSLPETNRQVRQWIQEVGNRTHGTTKQMPSKLFGELEAPALLPIPENPSDLATWAIAKVHPDCHVTYENSYYSVPYQYVGETLWLRETDRIIEVYRDTGGRLAPVALHPLAESPGIWRTTTAHLPPEKLAYLLSTPQHCVTEAGLVGPRCEEFIVSLLGKGHVDYLRAAQGVLRLRKKFGSLRVEAACHRALVFDSISYGSVKRILKAGLDQVALDEVESCIQLPVIGPGRFGRSIASLLQPEKYEGCTERSIV